MTGPDFERQPTASGGRTGRKMADDALIAQLCLGATIKDAASRANVSERTARNRLADPDFTVRLAEAKRDALERATAALGAASVDAVAALIAVLGSSSPSAKLAAAVRILELGAKLREATEFEARLARLEQLLAQPGGLRRVR